MLGAVFRGYGYDNNTNYDAYYFPVHRCSIPENSIASWDAGLRYNGELIKSQLITNYQRLAKIQHTIPLVVMVVMIRRRRSMRWKALHRPVGKQCHRWSWCNWAGIDWKQEKTDVRVQVMLKMEMINVTTGIYLTGLQQVGDFTFEGAAEKT